VFNLCEDFEGKGEGQAWMAGLLEMLKVPYTGSAPESLMLAADKSRSKEVFVARGIPTPGYRVIKGPPGGRLRMNFPLIIKPTRGDGSLGIERENVVYGMDGFYKRSKELLADYPSLLIEEFVSGSELSVAILDGEVLAMGEVCFTRKPAVFTYGAKWHRESLEYNTVRVMYTTDQRGKEDAAALALMAFKAIGLRDYGRVDIRLDERSRPFVIDVNPNPDISRDSGFARALVAAGIEYEEFIALLITWAADRGEMFEARMSREKFA
jgi:D-alanine-D-alanine ligase